MNATKQINKLWEQMQAAIDAAYEKNGRNTSDALEPFAALRDYTSDYSRARDLRDLLERETANERQHRHGTAIGFAGNVRRSAISSVIASKLILLGNIANGASKAQMPAATMFLVFRKTAIEAQVIGWIIREFLPADFAKNVGSLDYAKLMNP